MVWKINRIILFFIIIYLLDVSDVYARKRICDIKFNVKVGVKELENKLNMNNRNKILVSKSEYYCYQIGVEHDINLQPISTKPIYACCRD